MVQQRISRVGNGAGGRRRVQCTARYASRRGRQVRGGVRRKVAQQSQAGAGGRKIK